MRCCVCAESASLGLSLQSAALCNKGQQPAPGQGFIATWTGSWHQSSLLIRWSPSWQPHPSRHLRADHQILIGWGSWLWHGRPAGDPKKASRGALGPQEVGGLVPPLVLGPPRHGPLSLRNRPLLFTVEQQLGNSRPISNFYWDAEQLWKVFPFLHKGLFICHVTVLCICSDTV